MATWQQDLLDEIRSALPPGSTVTPYGSAAAGPDGVDGWSDLDVRIALAGSDGVDATSLVGVRPWAWQESDDGRVQQLRLVLVDGRRVDVAVEGGRVRLPEPPVDNAMRFDAALAAVRLGRGNALIGTHLVLGVLREALVQVMHLVDDAEGTDHHWHGSDLDARAAEVAGLLGTTRDQSSPDIARAAYGLYGRWRTELDPTYSPDPSGLDAVIARGTARAH